MSTDDEEFENTEEEFEAEESPDVEDHGGSEGYSFSPGGSCSEGDCENTYNNAEEYWIQLMSAIPRVDQTIQPKPADGIALPSVSEFQDLVNQVRPQPIAKHAIDVIRTGWETDFFDKLQETPDLLRQKVKDLANGWEGSDYAAFEDACNETANILNDILDNSEEVTSMMADFEQTLGNLQDGNGAGAPFPPPQIWTHKKWFGLNQEIHLRPAFSDGECERHPCGTIEMVLEKAGLDPGEANEVQEYKAARQQYYYDKYNRDGEEPPPGKDPFTMSHAADMAQADADETASQKAEEGLSDYGARYQTVMDDLFERRNMVNTEMASFRLPNLEVTPPVDVDPDDMNLGGMTPGAPGAQGAPPMGMPSSALQSPGGPVTSLSPAPAADHPPTENALTAPPGHGGNTTAPSTGGNNPWAMPSDPDNENENSDGLLAGGAGPGMAGGAAGAAPAAPGIGGAGAAGAGAGGAGGMAAGGARGGLFGPGAGAGAGSGAGGGAGAGRGGMGSGMGRGAGGRMGMGGGMMGGGRGQGDGEEEDKESTNWLVEDDDVWGLRNPDHEQFS